MKTTAQLDAMYDEMINLELCSTDEIELVTGINGYKEETVNRSREQEGEVTEHELHTEVPK